MRLNLKENMQKALKDVVDNALEVALASNQQDLIEEYKRFNKIISQGHYRTFSNEDIEVIWYFSDIGMRTCDMLLEQAKTPEQFEKTHEVKGVYQSVKDLIESEIDKKRSRQKPQLVIKE